MREADWGIGIASVEEIDALNIYEASRLAMKCAVAALDSTPEHLLIDAMTLDSGIPETSIVKGDATCVHCGSQCDCQTERDQMMAHYDTLYPGYEFLT